MDSDKKEKFLNIVIIILVILAIFLAWKVFSCKEKKCPDAPPCPECPKCPPSLDKAVGSYSLPDNSIKTIKSIDENSITLQGAQGNAEKWSRVPTESFVETATNNGTCSCDNFCSKDWGNEIKSSKPSWAGSKCGYKANAYKAGVFQGIVDCDKNATSVYPDADQQTCYCVEDSQPYKEKGNTC